MPDAPGGGLGGGGRGSLAAMAELRGMTPEEFRRRGHEMVDWLADYMARVDSLPIVPQVRPGDIRAMLPAAAPEEPEGFEDIAADLDRVVAPGLAGWSSPGWFAWFPCSVSGPGTLGELAAAGLGQQGMVWATSPASTELENAMVDWMADLLGLPAAWKMDGPGGGVIQQTASDGAHIALVVAREIARGRGAAVDECVAYLSDQANLSLEKGARIAGYSHIRLLETDEAFALRVEALEEAAAADRRAGLAPAFVCTTVGTTATTAVDPVRAAGEAARREGMWHHVDAAFAGSAMICEEFRRHQDGLELVDSYSVNPYKWLPVNFDGSLFYVADRTPLIDAMTIAPPYLRDSDSGGGAVNYRDWHIALGRRFRSLKLWFALRYYGAAALRAKIREDVRLARMVAGRVEADERFELVAPVPFSLVCLRHAGGDEATGALAEAVNRSGHSFCSTSRLDDRLFLRIAVGQINTREEHVERLWRLIDEAAPPAGRRGGG